MPKKLAQVKKTAKIWGNSFLDSFQQSGSGPTILNIFHEHFFTINSTKWPQKVTHPRKKGILQDFKTSPLHPSLATAHWSPSNEISADPNDRNLSNQEISPPEMKDVASSEREDEQIEADESDFESDQEWKGLTSKELGKRLAELSCKIDDDNNDVDWIPPKL